MTLGRATAAALVEADPDLEPCEGEATGVPPRGLIRALSLVPVAARAAQPG